MGTLKRGVTYLDLAGRAAGSSVTGFRPLSSSTTDPLATLPLVDTDTVTSALGDVTTKLSGADLVAVSGSFELFTDKPAAVGGSTLGASVPAGVSAAVVGSLEKLCSNQLC